MELRSKYDSLINHARHELQNEVLPSLFPAVRSDPAILRKELVKQGYSSLATPEVEEAVEQDRIEAEQSRLSSEWARDVWRLTGDPRAVEGLIAQQKEKENRRLFGRRSG